MVSVGKRAPRVQAKMQGTDDSLQKTMPSVESSDAENADFPVFLM